MKHFFLLLLVVAVVPLAQCSSEKWDLFIFRAKPLNILKKGADQTLQIEGDSSHQTTYFGTFSSLSECQAKARSSSSDLFDTEGMVYLCGRNCSPDTTPKNPECSRVVTGSIDELMKSH